MNNEVAMKLNKPTIFIVDDDLGVIKALRWLFESLNYQVETHNSAQSFLKSYDIKKTGCLITDMRMPVMGGLELLEHMKSLRIPLPIIVITGHGDISMAVRAMKLGAIDFVLKPINDQHLLEIVQKCINKPSIQSHEKINERINRLSKREKQVIDLILDGKLNKEIAYELSISISTVEAHRANIMQKMEAKTVAQLIKLYLQSDQNS